MIFSYCFITVLAGKHSSGAEAAKIYGLDRDKERTGSYRQLFYPEEFITWNNVAANNYTRGQCTIDEEVIDVAEATYEIQLGHVKCPAHRNTTWDWAKFEVCSHKWADVSESGFGVALLNDSKYDHSCHDGVLSLSIARGPTALDAFADYRSSHQFTYALMPHRASFHRPENGALSVIQAAYNLNNPTRRVSVAAATAKEISGRSWFELDNPAVIIEAVKVAEDGKSLILRLYESHGGKAVATLTTPFKVKVFECNLLEERLEGEKPLSDD